MKPLRNEMILASAGSGKTYRLTNRFIALLARDVSPERIIALTFTRKAASEFLDEILKKLAQAAAEPGMAQRLGAELELDTFDSARALVLLRRVIDRLHQLTLGTLDSFFHRILACFPAEFGLSTNFEVLSPDQEAEARAQVFAEIFRDRRLHSSFTEAFKHATFGTEEKQLAARLDGFVRSYHHLYLRQPKRVCWGHEATIWPEGCRWLGDQPPLERTLLELRQATDGIEMANKARGMWEDLLTKFGRLQPGDALPQSTAIERILGLHQEIRLGGPLTLKLDRYHYDLPPAACRQLARLLDYLLYHEVPGHLQRTQGVYQLLDLFERDYHEQIRRAGKLGFEDIQMLLNGSLDAVQARPLSLVGGDGRLHVDYRLDGQFDHWLLDEFQDTSNGQWRVISNLIDEVLQDSENRRSLFYVGDVKQAIFGWRGGDSALFHDIYEHYNSLQPESIRMEHMEDSFRSGPALMEAINRIFGDFARLSALFPDHPELVKRWADSWVDHTTHHKTRPDYVELLTVPRSADFSDAETELSADERRLAVVTALLEKLAPHEKNLSCAILVRRNRTAAAIANAIRASTNVPVTVETDTLIGTDHPVASSFLSLLQFVAHPGDSTAWRHLCMTPALCDKPAPAVSSLRNSLPNRTLALLHDQGFLGTLDDWLLTLQSGGFQPDAFAEHRMKQLRQAAHEFDQQGNRSITDFLRYAEATVSRETPAPGVVQILTIHKSKGLGFDIVIVAELESHHDAPLTQTGNLSIIAHEEGSGLNRQIDWILSMPPKDICQLDPQLQQARHRCEVERGYEELCVLYVALTRAKFATHMVCIEPRDPGKLKGSARDLIVSAFPPGPESPPVCEFAGESVTIAYAAGDPDWALERPASSPDASAPPPPVLPITTASRRFPSRRRAMPSSIAEESSPQKSRHRYLFSFASRHAAKFGTVVHALFEQIEWLDNAGADWFDPAPFALDPLLPEAEAEVRNALKEPAIRAIFEARNFGSSPSLWREKRFEMIHDDAWISGTFDRVVLTDTRAWIFDFKTNRVSSSSEVAQARDSYLPQLEVYRKALSRITGLPEDSIEAHLIFTKPGLLV